MSEKPRTGPYAKLLSQVVTYIADELEWMPDHAIGDSPIEKIFYTALWAHLRFTDGAGKDIVIPERDKPLSHLLSNCGPSKLIVCPQHQLEGWRVDFLIHAWDFGRVTGRPQWRRLIVECDGHEFHERTKEQAERDRGRDREWQLRGYSVLRFPGSKLHADPLGCATQISEWVEMGW